MKGEGRLVVVVKGTRENVGTNGAEFGFKVKLELVDGGILLLTLPDSAFLLAVTIGAEVEVSSLTSYTERSTTGKTEQRSFAASFFSFTSRLL